MSRTLNLVDRILGMGQLFQQMGRDRDAYRIFTRLAGFRKLPRASAALAQIHLAELQLSHGRFKDARRHLTRAIGFDPNNPKAYFLMGQAHDQDDDGDITEAYRNYRESIDLDPDQPECLGNFGLVAICLGRAEEGLKALRRAVELAPDDADAVANLLEGLCQMERPEEARRTMRAALFRNSRHPGFRKLWSDFCLREVLDQQAADSGRLQNLKPQPREPVILRYVRPRPASPAKRTKRKIVRSDGPTPTQPPHEGQTVRIFDH